MLEGLMMSTPLTLPPLLERTARYMGRQEIVSVVPNGTGGTRRERTTYLQVARRARRLADALHRLGLRPGDRVATFCWNHARHLEAYFGIPWMGGVLHTLNLRLHPDDLAYIINHAGDRALIVDDVLLPLFDRFKDRVNLEHVIVLSHGSPIPSGDLDYEALLAEASEDVDPAVEDENQAAGMCYTSGTTGQPKGVVYSHRALVLHSLVSALTDTLGIGSRDSVMPVVPMFHANGWGLPFTATLVGARQVFPGPKLDPQSLAELMAEERVTVSAGVPTIWLGLLQLLDKDPQAYDLSSLRALVVGGAAAPQAMIEGFQERHGITVVHAWGMTETTPLGTVANLKPHLLRLPEAEQYRYRAKQGVPVPFIEVRAMGENGPVPADGRSMGEMEVRGPWVARAYYDQPDAGGSFTPDGWFRTGDIVTIDPEGYVEIQDRTKDLVKSGGEWISSVALENALMGHPAVKEAAVIAVPHPRWQERPLAVVALKEGVSTTSEELRAHLESRFAKWWIPDAFEFVDEIPRTSTGKFQKMALRERFAGYHLPDESPA